MNITRRNEEHVRAERVAFTSCLISNLNFPLPLSFLIDNHLINKDANNKSTAAVHSVNFTHTHTHTLTYFVCVFAWLCTL
jgi:hypothetical protein